LGWPGENGTEKDPENSLAKSKLARTICGKNKCS
jgi:hypothetical protein